jgi:muramidase (phage lysozyme)
MDQELRDLVEQMRQLIPVLQNISGTGATSPKNAVDGTERMVRSVDRVVVALGALAVKLDTSKKNRVTEQEAIEKFTKAVEKTAGKLDEEEKERQAAIDKLEEEAKAREEAIRKSKLSQEQLIKEEREQAQQRAKAETEARSKNVRRQAEDLNKAQASSAVMFDAFAASGSASELLKTRFFDLAGDSIAAQTGLRVLGAAGQGATQSLKLFATGLLDGKQGAELSAKAVSEFAKPLLELGSLASNILTIASFFTPAGPMANIIKWGMRAGAALLGLGTAAISATLKVNEMAAKQLDAQLKSFNELSRGGIAVENGIDGIIDAVQTLGMTMSEIEQFNKLIVENNRNLAIMGGTSQLGAKAFTKVAGDLTKGQFGRELEYMGITMQEQREVTLSYMSILARTGQLQLNNTNKLVESSANYIRELDLAAQLTGTTRKDQQEAREAALAETRFRAALTQAMKEGNVAEINRLKRVQEVASMYRKTLGEEAFVGALQLGASRGALTTEAATQLELSTGFTSLIEDTNLTVAQVYDRSVKTAVAQADSLASINAIVGDIKGFQIASVPLREDEARQAQLRKAAEARGFTGPDAVIQFVEAVKDERIKVDKNTKDLIDANRAQRAATMTMERGISQFNIAAEIHETASKTFADAVSTFGDIIGTQVPGGTPVYDGGTASAAGKSAPAVPAPSSTKSGTAAGAAAATTIDAKTAQAALQEATAKRVKITEEKGAASPEARAARIAEFKARRQAERAGAAEMSARARVGQETPLAGERPTTSATRILDIIGKAESGGNYNILVGGKVNPELTSMTIREVLDFQRNMIAQGHESTAVGKYQIVQKTLQGLLNQGVVTPNETFSPGTQDKLAIALLNEKGFQKFQSGKMSAEQFADAIAQVWAGLPLSSGVSAAQGVGSNKATISRQEVLTALSDAPKARDGGMFSGPMTGYPAVLHGKEAVIPLKNGAVPVSLPSLDELVSSNRAVDAQVQVLRNEMGSMMRELTNAMIAMKDSGSQQRMIELLESISRNQQTTATASTRMAQLASN